MSSPKPSESSVKQAAVLEQKTVPEATVPWYKHDIGPRLKPASRAIYRDFSGLKDDDIVDHLHAILR